MDGWMVLLLLVTCCIDVVVVPKCASQKLWWQIGSRDYPRHHFNLIGYVVFDT